MQFFKSSALFCLLSLFLLAGSCSDEKGRSPETNKPKPKRKRVMEFTNPDKNSRFTLGDSIAISMDYRKPKNEGSVDSIRFFLNGRFHQVLSRPPFSFTLPTEALGTGFQTVSASIFQGGKQVERNNLRMELLSDLTPTRYGFRVVNRYPHDEKAWTQGLFFQDGMLYEGTGQKGASSIRKVAVETGKIEKIKMLDSKYFGEGIAALGNELFQLTWRERVGFVYDFNTFELKREFRYATEGWGLTTDGTHLIMSDGSEFLYFMDPQGFAETKKIAVYTNKGPIKKLNELEYIDGEIYANVWETDNVLRIDPETGKVLGIIDLSDLMDRRGMDEQAVLNGVAWDAQNERMFVTGKWWPALFEIAIMPLQ